MAKSDIIDAEVAVGPVCIPAGSIVRMSARQFDRRAHNVTPLDVVGQYRVDRPIQFKRGEKLGVSRETSKGIRGKLTFMGGPLPVTKKTRGKPSPVVADVEN